jgi:hypothetical protein
MTTSVGEEDSLGGETPEGLTKIEKGPDNKDWIKCRKDSGQEKTVESKEGKDKMIGDKGILQVTFLDSESAKNKTEVIMTDHS